MLRPKDLQDNATPSGNALACEALLKLSALTDRGDFRDLAENSLKLSAEVALRHPTAYAHWLSNADFAIGSVKQVALLGEAQNESTQTMLKAIRSAFRPNLVIAQSQFPPSPAAPNLLAHRKPIDNRTTAFVCEGFVCKRPVTKPSQLRKLLQ